MADYWLSIWDADRYPKRTSIVPSKIKALLPGLIIFSVLPGASVRVRMAGTGFYNLLKQELTGQDWLVRTPAADRDQRLAVFSDVARGAAALGRWTFADGSIHHIRCEKLLLPLSPAAGEDEIPALGFIDWTAASGGHGGDLQSIPLPRILGAFPAAANSEGETAGKVSSHG